MCHHRTVHLSADELLPPDKICPICGSEERVSEFQLQQEPDVWLLTCQRCSVSSAARMPSNETLEAYYRDYYAESEPAETASEKVTFDIPERLARHIHQQVVGMLQGDRAAVLDFGGGDGTISINLGKILLSNSFKEVRITLVDLSGHVREAGDSPLVVELCSRLKSAPKESFDLVIVSAVLEHIPYPAEDLKSLLCSIKPGGIFYARTPYILPLMRLAAKAGFKIDFSYPGHLHDMGQPFWEAILEALGLETQFQLIKSEPSIVETTFGKHFFRTLIAHMLKAPWFILGRSYHLVGGWQVFIRRR
jgi:2-polyprenyl-3-methyl-5-hydroxy-6-metoxy-1,4-benzoquinol methylase